jgi:hypothetical protein
VDNNQYYPLLSEQNRYVLWGYSGPAERLTAVGQDLLANTLNYLLWQ